MAKQADPRQRPRIRDLAAALSLSQATVSKALNGRRGVNADTHRRVLSKARQLGYVPDQRAQALRQGRSHRIGFLLPDFQNPYYVALMHSAQAAAREKGFELITDSSAWEPQREQAFCHAMLSARADGLIVVSPTRDHRATLEQFASLGMPAVTLTRLDASGAAPQVSSLNCDRTAGMRWLTEHLLGLGHRRLGYLAYSPDRATIRDRARLAGITQALQAAGLDQTACELIPLPRPELSMQIAYDAMAQRIAERHRLLPTAILGSNDQIALSAIAALQDAGLRVPQDVSVAGFDNIEAGAFYRPSLTTVSQTHLDLGRRAVELVLERIASPDAPAVHALFEPRLVVRQSTGPAPAANDA